MSLSLLSLASLSLLSLFSLSLMIVLLLLGSVSKVNEYIILRDLGQGSSAQVKLCRLIPNRSQRGLAGAKEEGLARDCPGVPEFGADTDDEDDQYVRAASTSEGGRG